MLRLLLIVVMLVANLAACDKFLNKGEKKDASAAPAKLLIAPEDILTVQANDLSSGPVVTGSIQPERKADLRADSNSR